MSLELCKDFPGSLNGVLNVLICVCERCEASLQSGKADLGSIPATSIGKKLRLREKHSMLHLLSNSTSSPKGRDIRLCVQQDSQDQIVQEAARPHTSYADGARYTPLSSMPLCQRPNLAMSALVASSKQLTGPFVKKNPNMPASNCHLTR